MLVAMPERWDEACFAVPALRALVKTGLVGGLLCRQEQEAFWKTVCDLRVIACQPKENVRAVIGRMGEGWEASLVWEAGIFAKAFAKAGIEKRLGPDDDSLKKLLTHPMTVKEGATEHRVRMYLKTCEEMGVPADKAEYFVAAPLGIPATPGSILLCPGSDFGASHEWPLDRWQEVAEGLLERKMRHRNRRGGWPWARENPCWAAWFRSRICAYRPAGGRASITGRVSGCDCGGRLATAPRGACGIDLCHLVRPQ